MGKIIEFIVSPLSLIDRDLGRLATSAFLIAAGVATGNLALISAGVSMGASVLQNKSPRNSLGNADRLRANIDPLTPRKTVVGVTAMATDIRDEEFTDDQEYFHRFIVCASHEVESIDEIWFDDKRVWTLGGGVEGDASGYLEVAVRTVGTAANAINISSRMGSTRRYTGLAYIHLRYKLTGNSKKAESPYAQGITPRITIRGKGARLYDPRLDSTVPGGSGTQRADDQATWVWDADACRNPALALLFYLLGWNINGLLAVGKGIPPERIDLESFAVAANICDEVVATESGGTEPRYRCDGVWSEGDDPTTVIEMLKATMNADLDDVGGKLRLTIFHNDLADVVADFTDDDIIDGFEWQAVQPLDQTFNVVRGVYTDATDDGLYQQVDYPQQEVASPDGITRVFNLNLPMVQSADQAQRLANMRLKRQALSGTFVADYQATAWKVQKNSIIRQSFTQTGFVDKLFRVAEMEVRQDGVVPLVLVEEDASIYAGGDLAPPIAAIPSTPYNPALNPFLQAVNDASSVIVGPATATVEAKTDATPADGELPAIYEYALEIDGNVVSGAVWAATVTLGTATVSIVDGDLTLSSISSNDVRVRVSATYQGLTKATLLRISKRLAGVDINTGTGGSSSADNSFNSFNSTSYVVVTDVMNMQTGTAGEVDLSAPLTLKVGSGAPTGSYSATLQWEQDIGGTWTAVGSEHVSGNTQREPDGTVIPASASANETLTGLTASAAYSFRLTAKANEADGETRFLSGTASATGS